MCFFCKKGRGDPAHNYAASFSIIAIILLHLARLIFPCLWSIIVQAFRVSFFRYSLSAFSSVVIYDPPNVIFLRFGEYIPGFGVYFVHCFSPQVNNI